MAYLRDIPPSLCRFGICGKKATVTLINARNAVMGDYCKRHGTIALKNMQLAEKKQG